MKTRQNSEKPSAAAPPATSVQAAAFLASSGSFAPSSRTIRLPPPTPNRLDSAPTIKNTVSTSEDAATM